MEIGVPNSFIPRDATTPAGPSVYHSGGGLPDLLMLIAIVLVVASGALGVGSFLYLQYLNGVSASKQASIQQVENSFDPSLIQQLSDLDSRMNAAQQILSNHLAPSAFFAALNQTSLATISFSNLTLDATDPKNITLQMSGVAQDINGIALQADLFSKGGVIVNPIFSGINQQLDGVHFTLSATINPAALSYESLVTGEPASGVNTVPLSTSTAATSSSGTSPFTGSASQTQGSPAPAQQTTTQ